MLADQFVKCTTSCGEDELSRAKNQLKSAVLMGLESQSVGLEDVARQILGYGGRLDGAEICRRIDTVECGDIVRIGRRVFLGENTPSPFSYPESRVWKPTGNWGPTVLVQGNLTGKKDGLWKVGDNLRKWGLMSGVPGRKKKFE